MAILDEEEDTLELPLARDPLALEGTGAVDTTDPYAGENDEDYVPAAPSALALPAYPRTRRRSPEMQARLDQFQAQLNQRQTARRSSPQELSRRIQADPAYADTLVLGPPLEIETTTAPKPPEEAGWGQIRDRGLLRAKEAILQGKDIAEGKEPRASDVPPADYEAQLRLEDFGDPVLAAKKLWLSLWQSAPVVATTAAGAIAGMPGGPLGVAAGGAFGAGIGSGLMTIGPAYGEELQALGENRTPEGIDKAWGNAWTTTLKSMGVDAASAGLLGVGKPFSNAIKSILTPVIAGAAKPVAGVPLRLGVQAVGQPAIALGGEATANLVSGKPVTENWNPAAASAVANVVEEGVGMLAGRFGRGLINRRRATPGVSDDQKLALDATQQEPPLDLTLDMTQRALPPPSPENRPRLPAPEGQLALPAPDASAGALPPITPENRPPLGPAPPEAPPAGMAPDIIAAGAPPGGGGTPVDFSIGRPPDGGLPPPPPPEGGGPVPPPRPQPFIPEPRPIETAPTRPQDFGVGAPAERPAMPPPPLTTPEEFGISRPPGAEAPPITPTGGEPPPPRPQPFTPEPRPVETPPTRPSDFTIDRPVTIEPDHLDATRAVAKQDDMVVGKGATPEEALADARARGGAPYVDEVPAEKAISPAPGTKGQLVSEKAPPAAGVLEAAAEPAARGRDAVPETPVKQTLAQEVKAKGEARRAKQAPPPQGERDVTQEVREGILTDREDATRTQDFDKFTEQTRAVLAGQKLSETRRNNDLQRRQEAWDAGFDAGLRDTLTGPQWNAPNVVTSFRAGRETGRRIREERAVTKQTEKRSSEQKKPLAETVTKPSEVTEKSAPAGRQKFWVSSEEGGIVKPLVGIDATNSAEATQAFYAEHPNRTIRSIRTDIRDETTRGTALRKEAAEAEAKAKQEGARTKTGAYTMGEGEEVTRQRKGPTEAQAARAEADEIKRNPKITSSWMAQTPPGGTSETRPITPGLNSLRRAQFVVQNIVAGQSLTDAIRDFGARKPGAPGPKPKFEKLSQYIRDFLKAAETGQAEANLRAKLADTEAQLRKAGPKAPSDITEKILDNLTKDLQTLERVRANKTVLEEAATRLEALERGEPIKGAQSMRGRMREMGRQAQQLAATYFSNRPEVNQPIKQQLEASGEHGSRLHDLLDALTGHAPAQRLTPQLTELANVLRRVLPNVEVHDAAGRLQPDVVGAYVPGERRIYLDLDSPSVGVNLLHEGVHTGTFDYTNHLYQTPEINLTPRELAHKSALDAIDAEVRRILNERGDLSPTQYGELQYALNRDTDPSLNMAGPHELASQLLTTPELYNVLSRETASPQFRAALDRVGMGISSKASIWDGFKRIVRNIFGVPDRLDSVFDHVLRPLTEIVETGAKFRRPGDAAEIRNTARHNAEVLGPAKLRTPHSMRELKDAARALGGNIGDPKLRTALRGVFHTVTQDAYIDYIAPYIPAAIAHREAHRRVGNAIAHERVRDYTTYDENGKAIVEPHVDKTDRLHNQLRYGRDGDAAQELMTDITFAKADLLDPKADNSHVDSDTLKDLQARWAALDPAARQAARESFQVYTERNRASREAEVRQLTETAFPDMPRSQHDDIVRHMSTLGGIEDILTNVDRSALAQTLGPRWANSKDLFRHLAENQRGGFVRGNYAPLNRFGEYVVSAGKANTPEYEVQMFERWSQAAAFRDKLKLERDDVSQLFVKSDENFRQSMVPDQVLGSFDVAMAKAGITGDQARVLREQYAGALINQGLRQAQRTMKREYIAGASNEQARNLMMDFMSHTTRMGHLKHQGEVIRTLFQAEKENRELHQPGPKQGTALQVAVAQAGVEEMRRRMPPVDGDSSADLMGTTVRGITTLTLLQALVRPAKLAMDVAGTHAFALSMIGGKHGAVKAAAAVTKAYAQLTGATLQAAGRGAMAAIMRDLKAKNWMLSEVYRKRLHDADDISNAHADLLIDNLNASNLINQTHMSEVRRMAGPDGWTGANGRLAVVARLLDMNAAAEHAIDSAMRVGNAKAAFVTHLNANPGDVTGALDYANYIARKSQPDWNFYNRSRLTTKQGALGQFGSVVTQFKSFGFHAYGVQGGLIVDAYRKGGAERREALKTLALLHGSHALLWGGVGATLFNGVPMMAAMGLYDAFSGEDPHTNREWETWSRNYMRNTFGKTVADVYQNGLPTVAGINTSASLRFSNIVGVPPINTYDIPGFTEFGFKVATGVSGGEIGKMLETAKKIVGGDTSWETVTSLAPRIIEDPIKAGMWASGGMKSARGDRIIVPAEQFTTSDILAKGLGFQPARASDAQYARGAIDLAMDVREKAQEPLLKNLIRAVADKRGTKEAMAEIKRFNDAVKPQDRITGQQIQQRLRAQAQANARPGLYGMQVPRRQYGKVEELTQFMRP